MELWLEHYLGIFLDFRTFGILNWLGIPLFIYFLATIKRRKRWEIAIAFVFFISCVLICIFGKGYSRYFFTLYPFTLGAIFLFGWEFIKKKSHPVQVVIFIIIMIAVFFNYYNSRESYKFLWNYKIRVADDYFPHGLIKYINNAEGFITDSTTLVLSHRHIFFYHTDKKGIDFRDPKLEFFNRRENKEAALDVLKNQLNIKYIYLIWNFKTKFGMTKILGDIIRYDCDLVYQDKNGYKLFKIRDKDLDREELEKIFVNDSLLKNGSFENWSRGPFRKPDFFEGGDNVLEGMAIKEEKEVKVGRYSVKITGDNFNFTQVLANNEELRGEKLTCFVWVKTNVPDKYRITIGGGLERCFSRYHSGSGEWELLQANLTVNPSVENIIIRIVSARKTGNVDAVVYVDGALLVEGDWNTFYFYRLHMDKDE